MALIKSISGIRGTIGGLPGTGLSPLDLVKFSSAYATWLKETNKSKKHIVILGRDSRISGEMVSKIVAGTLMGMGIDVINLGMATTPTVEVAVANENAHGGIILTASHNPKEWNALKLLNSKGEFISSKEGEYILQLAEKNIYQYADVENIGKESFIQNYEDKHIEMILKLPLVKPEIIEKAKFKIAIDCVNSVGGIVIPKLLKKLGVMEVFELFCEPNGIFPHNPEPLPEHLAEISELVKKTKADLGFVVDPDVDRLAIINEDGSMFGEEYTLVAVADYILCKTPGNTVSNLSSSRALEEITVSYGGNYNASAVGEVNVVEKMKETSAIIGGEGNGGVIFPELHYGRDALVGIALFLTHLAEQQCKCSILRTRYPEYYISKNKIELIPGINIDKILKKVIENFKNEIITTIDGVKIDFEEGWVHLRKSNTEPIIRIYSESKTMDAANKLAKSVIDIINSYK